MNKLNLSDSPRDLLLAQYDSLRCETLERLKELWKLEQLAIGGATAIAAWLLLNQKIEEIPELAWWLPFVVILIAGFRFASGMYHLDRRTSIYLIAIEETLSPKNAGWEKWFRELGPNETIAHSIIWFVSGIATLCFALFQPHQI